MSLTNPEASGLLLDGIKAQFVDEGEAFDDASDLKWFCTLIGINGFGLMRATQPNIHNGVTTTTGANIASYLISQIRLQKEFTIDVVFTAGMSLPDIVKKTSASKQVIFGFPAEEGYSAGEVMRGKAECTDVTLTGQVGGRVQCSIKVTPKGAFAQTTSVAV